MNQDIKTMSNPDNRKNWIISITVEQKVCLKLRYIPHKLIAIHSDVEKGLKAYLEQEWLSPEDMVLRIIEDFNNTLIPRWLEITYKYDGNEIIVEDTQPGFEK